MKEMTNVKKLVLTGVLAAMVCVATYIQIPYPMGQGYVNLGDCLVLVSAWVLGPIYGAAAAGIGSAMTDLFLGYFIYAPATLIIKGLMAVVAALILKAMTKSEPEKLKVLPLILGGFVAELIMVGGYFLFEYFIMQYGAVAVADIVGNAIQGCVGWVLSVVLYMAISGILRKVKS